MLQLQMKEPNYHQKAEIFWQQFIKFIGDEDPSDIQLQVGFVCVVVALIQILWCLRRHKENSLELNITFSSEMAPG